MQKASPRGVRGGCVVSGLLYWRWWWGGMVVGWSSVSAVASHLLILVWSSPIPHPHPTRRPKGDVVNEKVGTMPASLSPFGKRQKGAGPQGGRETCLHFGQTYVKNTLIVGCCMVLSCLACCDLGDSKSNVMRFELFCRAPLRFDFVCAS